MKKLVAALGMTALLLLLAGCEGSYQVVDFTYYYDYAIIQLPNGEVIEGKVDAWKDYEDGEQLQVKINGTTYLTNSYNCVLIARP